MVEGGAGAPTSDGGRPRAVVIGAGPAGIAAALMLQRRFPEPGAVVVVERGNVAASWRARYAELSLNTTRRSSALPGRRLTRAAGRWVSRDDYIRYLEVAARALRTPARTGVEAQRVRRGPNGRWFVETGGGELAAANVVVATGSDAVPRLPDWPDRSVYGGAVFHVADLRSLAGLAGRSVVVVGAGNSGVDIAGRLAASGARVVVAMRTPPTVVPRERFGVPLQPLGIATRWLPRRMRDAMTTATVRLVTGDLARYGIPRPEVGPYTRFAATGVTVAVDNGFVAQLRARRVRVVPAAVGWEPTGVRLADGSVATSDVVILATGFRCGLEPLLGHLDVLDAHGRPRPPLPGPVASLPGLFFAGFRPAVEGTLRRHRADARAVARLAR